MCGLGLQRRARRLTTHCSCNQPDPHDSVSSIYSAVAQSDGTTLIGGDFCYFNGVSRHALARLRNDGSIDTDFYPSYITGFPCWAVRAISLQSDRKILVGGAFNSPRNGFAHLYAGGGAGPTFAATLPLGDIPGRAVAIN